MFYAARNLSVGVTALVLAGMGFALAAPASAGFYDRKNVTVLIGAGAGGGLTRSGRTFTRVMQKHLGKGGNMVIKNMPGGGGIRALNFLSEKAKPNGLTVLWGPANQMAKLLELPGVRFDPADMQVIGVGSSTYVSIARTDAGKGIKRAADVVKAGGLIVGGRGTSDGLSLFARMPLDVLGVSYRYVPGYNSQPKMNAAIRSKEINFLTTGHPGYVAFYERTILKSGEALALYYHSPLDRSGKPARVGYYPAKLKHFADVYREAHGKAPSGPMWEAYKWISTYNTRPFAMFAPKGTAKEKVAELRAAYAKTAKDKEFRDAYMKQFKFLPDFVIGEAAEWLVTDYKKLSPAALQGLKRLTARKKKKK